MSFPAPRDGASGAAPRGFTLDLPGLPATERLAADLAGLLQPGDLVALTGDFGSGKSTLARAILRRLAEDPGLEVPSPTFTLMQSYDTPRGPVIHADLYRVRSADELPEMGLLEALEGGIGLVEWPDRAGSLLPPERRLDVVLQLDPARGDEARRVHLSGGPAWAQRLSVTLGARRLIDGSGWGDAVREHLQGDASTRAYERLAKPDGRRAILMISPPRPDGPPVRAGKPYSAVAKLAESVHAFVAVDRGLRALGYSAPEIHAEDLATGLLIIEDLGEEPVVGMHGPVPERYEAAALLLADMHMKPLPTILPVTAGRDHVVPDFDVAAMEIEVDLLLDWYVPHIVGTTLPAITRRAFHKAWAPLFDILLDGPRSWALRDFHSPNLIWLPERKGHARVGLIDFQDAVLAHPAYDLVSLGQDARVTVPPELELRLLGAYARARRAADPAFDVGAFARAYAILGAQRATKILGIFARLDKRDGKPAYLKHLPRVSRYLVRDLAHPDLAALKAWFEAHCPRVFVDGQDKSQADKPASETPRP